MEGGCERKSKEESISIWNCRSEVEFLNLKVMVLRRLETSGPTHPDTRRHSPEILNRQQSICRNLSGCCLRSPETNNHFYCKWNLDIMTIWWRWCVTGLKGHEGRHLLIHDLCYEPVGFSGCGVSVSVGLKCICKGAVVAELRYCHIGWTVAGRSSTRMVGLPSEVRRRYVWREQCCLLGSVTVYVYVYGPKI